MPVGSENEGLKGNLEIYMLCGKLKKKKSALLVLLIPFFEFSFTS